MNTKGILMSILMIGVVAMAAGAGTFAHFSDTETSTGNTFTAGTLDLKVNGSDTDTLTLSVSDIKPGMSGSNHVVLKNAGSIAGELDVEVDATESTGDYPEPEQVDDPDGDDALLDEEANFYLGLDPDDFSLSDDEDNNGNIVDDDEVFLIDSEGGTPTIASDQIKDAAATLDPSGTINFIIEYNVPDTVNNCIQGDGVNFDVTFTLEQPEAD